MLDGAIVLSTAAATPGQVGSTYNDTSEVPIHYFAIAQYPEDAPRAYLFGVSADHVVLCDFYYDSPEDAATAAKDSGDVTHDFKNRNA